jgi:hypothetical protein
MSLNLYRRHRRACKAGREHNSCSGEFEERRKGWKQCDCPIFASGTIQGEFKRKSTEVWKWDSEIHSRPMGVQPLLDRTRRPGSDAGADANGLA